MFKLQNYWCHTCSLTGTGWCVTYSLVQEAVDSASPNVPSYTLVNILSLVPHLLTYRYRLVRNL